MTFPLLPRFGLFGTDKDSISHVGLNYGGVVLAACSILLYLLVKDEISSAKPKDEEVQVAAASEGSPLLSDINVRHILSLFFISFSFFFVTVVHVVTVLPLWHKSDLCQNAIDILL